MMMRAAIPPPRTIDGERAQFSPQRRIIVIGGLGFVALSRAMLTHDPTRPALADAEAVAQQHDRPTPAGWA
jgi:hypothetical protein